eukprot:CAMPEP_0119343882 /NCGR_PEP_ID=MMETSP1333-20130426/106684_1 /TAXON_ID=418940 /ORGANISM="Scyphosphaera apsteinii, Strain RCC1455" /LENGTH=519 /DNA_ID=CAMNT_0007356301 /DNA_START=29 /DNA_END=1588 /DNA_ORIENTATION=-
MAITVNLPTSRQILLFNTLLQGLCSAFETLQPSESYLLWKAGWFAVVIDVRTTSEYASGHLPGAYLIDSLASNRVIPAVLGDSCKDCPLAVYCRTGSRSKEASRVLAAEGFISVYDILGVQQLFAHGFPAEKGVLSSPARPTSTCSQACRSNMSTVSMVTIGSGPTYWSAIPSSPSTYWVMEGDTLTFRYSRYHNVWLMDDEQAFETCNFEGATEIAGNLRGGGTGNILSNTHNADELIVGSVSLNTLVTLNRLEKLSVMYIACRVSSHCHMGQKIKIMVSPRPQPATVPHRSAPRSPAGSCYFYVTSCSMQAAITPNMWLRDSWGEANMRSGSTITTCEQTRRAGFASWCSIPFSAVTMHFNPPQVIPSAPRSPAGSCYFYVTSCSMQAAITPNMWLRDRWGEANMRSGSTITTCEQTRRAGFASWCSIPFSAVTMHFNPPQVIPSAPRSPAGSCYFYVTSCSMQAAITPNMWLRDSWGEANMRSGSDFTTCEQTRRAGFASWCGILLSAVTMHFNTP